MPPRTSLANGHLRILQTTDLHMQLLDYDYFADRPDPNLGLIGLCDDILALKSNKTVTTLWCDTGDLIQGNPLADTLTYPPYDTKPHPMIAALNLLGCDALTLGNHDGDYGRDFLDQVFSRATGAVVSANALARKTVQNLLPFVVLERSIHCDDGQNRPIKIGMTGFGPPQISGGVYGDDKAPLEFSDIITAAEHTVRDMRSAGAEVIVALCHAGLGAPEHSPGMENAAIPLAGVDGIDVVLMGHTHAVFPDRELPNAGPVDHATATVHGKPTVMAGYGGRSLGVIDLTLRWQADTWQIEDHTVRLVSARASQGHESKIRKSLRKSVHDAHLETLDRMQQPVAQTTVPIASYFATIQPDLSQQVLARAMQQAVKQALTGTEFAHLPVLAAKSSFRFGGSSGFGHYIDIPAGPITLSDLAAIFPFTDRCCGVVRTGRQIRLWLERSASYFNQIKANQPDQTLIAPQAIGYNCDTVYGLSYEIDLTQPARFDQHGVETDPSAQRVGQLVYKGQAVAEDARFVIATNSFRAHGGGNFPPIAATDIVYSSSQSVRDLLQTYLSTCQIWDEPAVPTWSFAPIPNASALFTSALAARAHAHPPVAYVDPINDCSARFRITF